MKTKSPRRPLTGAALASATKQIEADAEKIETASKWADQIIRTLSSQPEACKLEDLPEKDPRVLNIVVQHFAHAYFRVRKSRDQMQSAFADLERAHDRYFDQVNHLNKDLDQQNAAMSEAFQTIDALKAVLKVLLK